MESSLQRLENYIKVQPTVSMKDMNEQVMLAVLSILGLVTEEMRQGRTSEFVKAQCPCIIFFLTPYQKSI